MKRFILINIILLWATLAVGQGTAIRGVVIDGASQERLPFSNVLLMGVDDARFLKGCSTDENGNFAIEGIKVGNYQLKASSVGYKTFDTTITISASMDLGFIRLKRGVMLKEVLVVATKPLFSYDGEKNIYNTNDDPSIQSGTAVDALQNAPGIEVDADGNITLRGTQSVSFWINNRESHMNEEALKQYLKALPANAIQRIEVITNPSARYGGGQPVVNIIIEQKGLRNQFVSVGINANSRPEIDPWISYIFNNKKWEADIYASAGYTRNIATTTNEQYLLANNHDTSCADNYMTQLDERGLAPLISIDLAYHPDSLNTIALWLGDFAQWSRWESNTKCRRNEYIYSPGDYSFVENRSKSIKSRPSNGLFDGIWMEHIFDEQSGHSIGGGYFGGLWTSDSLVDVRRRYTGMERPDWALSEQHAAKEWIHGIEAFYILPFGSKDSTTERYSNELEAGLEGEYTSRTMCTVVDTLMADGTLQRCDWMSSVSQRKQLSGEAFASYTHRWGSLSAKAGLRATLSSGTMSYPEAPQYDFEKTMLAWTPSLHLSYTTEHDHTFSLGYTYRTNVPEAKDYTLYPTLRIDDFSIGNALLLPGRAHRLELKWDKYFNKFGSVELNAYYTGKKNNIGELTDVVYDSIYYRRIVTFTKPINIGDAATAGIDLNLSYRPSAFVNVRLDASLFYDYLDVCYRPDEAPINNGMICYAVRLNAWVKLWNQLQLFANAYYRSPTQNVLTTTLIHKGVDVGLNTNLFHNALSLNLSVNDLFDWNTWNYVSSNPFLDINKETKISSRYISLGITLRIGEMELERNAPRHKPNRNKKIDPEEE